MIFHPQAREAIRLFPKEVRDRLGRSLYRLQMGEQLRLPQARPMATVAAGVSELRVSGGDGIYRVFYQTAPRQNVLVFHFVKKPSALPRARSGLHRNIGRSFSMRKTRPFVAKTPEALAEALGLSAAGAKVWQVQYALLQRLKEIVRREHLTQAEIAKRAGTSRTRVTAILNDNVDDVSSDLLIRILGSLGYRVTVTVRKAAKVA